MAYNHMRWVMASAAEKIGSLTADEIAEAWESRVRGTAFPEKRDKVRHNAIPKDLLGDLELAHNALAEAGRAVDQEEGKEIIDTLLSEEFEKELLNKQNDRKGNSEVTGGSGSR